MAITFSGCSLFRTGYASLRSTSDFHPIEADSRVLAEPGAEDLARQAAGFLPEAVAVVEKWQYRDFVRPVEIYVCASVDSFVRHTGLPRQVRGAVVAKLFLSGKLKDPQFNGSTKAIMIHELSHLHLQQQLGVYHYNANLPAWFQEGLAVLVSGGGGAETVSEADAVKAILGGRHFTPESEGSFWFHKSAKSYGLEPQMFYCQASLFVKHLKDLSEIRFGLFMLAIEDGGDFGSAFQHGYGISVEEAWQDFVTLLRERQRGMRFAGYRSLRFVSLPSSSLSLIQFRCLSLQ